MTEGVTRVSVDVCAGAQPAVAMKHRTLAAAFAHGPTACSVTIGPGTLTGARLGDCATIHAWMRAE